MDWNKKVVDELRHNLYEWGVNGHHAAHVQFRQYALAECQAMLTTEHTDTKGYRQLVNDKFPEEVEEAVDHYVRSDMQEVPPRWITITDKLEEAYPQAPFRRHYAKGRTKGTLDKSRVLNYPKKKAYKGFSNEELDPLQRFAYEVESNAERMFSTYMIGQGYASEMGVVLEAVLACHAIKNEACYNCKCRNSLRWNGGYGASWQDLVCIQCEAMFELKTKDTMEKLEFYLNMNSIPGGSFRRYCGLRNGRKPGQKMYLVLLSRQAMLNRNMEHGRPVYIAEIDYVLPRLSGSSFIDRRSSTFKRLGLARSENQIDFKSAVVLKTNTKQTWFFLPKSEHESFYMDRIKTIFVDIFSQATFDALEEEHGDKVYTCDSDSDGEYEQTVGPRKSPDAKSPPRGVEPGIVKETQVETEAERKESQKIELEKEKVGDDDEEDWEDLYDV